MKRIEEWTEITIPQFKKGLDAKCNMLVFGKSGYGKSAAVDEYAKETGKTVVEINLALELPENIGGIPSKLKDGYFTKLLDAKLEPIFETEGDNYIIFFDEINQGSPEVFNALYGITHPDPKMRNWAGHNIGKAQIVACGNLSDGTDGTVYLNELPTPLLNRFFCFRLKPDNKSTLDYLKTKYKNIPQVARYISTMQDNDIAPRDIDLALEILNFNMDSMFLESKLGESLTAKLYDIQKKAKDLDPSQIIKNAHKIKKQLIEDGEVMFGAKTITTMEELADALSDYLTEEEIAGVMKGDE